MNNKVLALQATCFEAEKTLQSALADLRAAKKAFRLELEKSFEKLEVRSSY